MSKISKEGLEGLPESMIAAKRWLAYQLVKKGGSKKADKVPRSIVAGEKGSSTNENCWGTLSDAIAFLSAKGFPDDWGLGFALGGGFCGLDMDHVLEGNEIACDRAEAIMHELDGCAYAERSISGDGIHVVFNCEKPEGYVSIRTFDDGTALEFYNTGRFFTVSLDNGLFPNRDHLAPTDDVMKWICESWFKKGKPSKAAEAKANSSKPKQTGESLDNYIRTVIENSNFGEGSRNNALFKAAGSIRNKVESEFVLWGIMQNINAMHCNPPLDIEELRQVVESSRVNGTRPVENEYHPPASPQYTVEDDVLDQFETEGLDEFVLNANFTVLYDHLIQENGLLGNYLRHCKKSRGETMPMLDLSGALSFCSTLLSTRVRTEDSRYTTYPNLAVVALATSGKGKEHCIRLNHELLRKVGLEKRIGPDHISSGEGIASTLLAQGRGCCFFLDEFGDTLGDPSKSQSTFEKSLFRNFKVSITKSDTLWKATGRSDAKLNKQVNKSLVGYYMTSTPESFWRSFRAESTADGFLGRMLVIQVPNVTSELTKEQYLAKQREERRKTSIEDRELPEELMRNVRHWYGDTEAELALAAVASLDNIDGNGSNENMTNFGKPEVVFTYSPEAEDLLFDFMAEVRFMSDNTPDCSSPLWNRASAKVAKLALILAASEQGANGDHVITEANVQAALQFVKAEVRYTVSLIKEEMVSGVIEVIMKKIERGLKRNKKGLTVGSFRGKGLPYVEDANHRNALVQLEKEGRIKVWTHPETGNKRYFHRHHWDAFEASQDE